MNDGEGTTIFNVMHAHLQYHCITITWLDINSFLPSSMSGYRKIEEFLTRG